MQTARYVIEQNPKDNDSFPNISVVLSDSIEARRVFMEFGRHASWPEKGSASRTDFIHSCSTEENEYLS